MTVSFARLNVYVFPPQRIEDIMIDETMKALTEELIARGTSYDIDFLQRVPRRACASPQHLRVLGVFVFVVQV